MLLKIPVIEAADTPANCVLVGLLDRVKDSRAAITAAFGPLFRELNEINASGFRVRVSWAPAVPDGVEYVAKTGEVREVRRSPRGSVGPAFPRHGTQPRRCRACATEGRVRSAGVQP